MTTFRTAYGKRNRVKTSFKDSPSLTIQDQKKSTDINEILNRFQKTGLIDHVQQNEPAFADVTGYDFQTNQNTVATIQSMFNELPASVRQQFDHDPQKYIEHIAVQDNVEDMKDGVIDNPIAETTQDSLPVEDSSAPPTEGKV